MSFKLELGEISLDGIYGTYVTDMIMTVGSETIFTKHSYLIRFECIDVDNLRTIIAEFKKKDSFIKCSFVTINTSFDFSKQYEVLVIDPISNMETSDNVKIYLPFKDHVDMIIDFFEMLLRKTIKYCKKED